MSTLSSFVSLTKFTLMTSVAVGAIALSAPVHAMDENTLPDGYSVTEGSANVSTSGNYMTVDQHTGRVIIDWTNFNIGENATVEFVQPSTDALAVNRAGDNGDPTQILGTLKSNGRIMVIDRNGVIFGKTAVVNVGSIVATTGDKITINPDNTITLNDANGTGKIVNHGTITVAKGGLAAFVAPIVVNDGVIQAKSGQVILASGTHATIDFAGDGLINLALNTPLKKVAVRNKKGGVINADGGQVIMTTEAAVGVVDNLVNNAGIINVSSVKKSGGKIILSGDKVFSRGSLLANGKTSGGKILIQGHKHVHLDGIVEAHDETYDEKDRNGQGKLIVQIDKDGEFTGKNKRRDWGKSTIDIFSKKPSVRPVPRPSVRPVPVLTTVGTFNIEDTFNNNLARVTPTTRTTGITITGLPRLSNTPTRTAGTPSRITNLNDITPAAGGDTPTTATQVAATEPASGGSANASCWGDALNLAATGQTVTYTFDQNVGSALNDAASCANGI